MKLHASESNHWYDREGNPRYTMPYADPKKGFRNTTLRDARKEGFQPSVTTILAVPNKPALNRWKENQILMSALTLPQIDGETLDEFSYRVMEDSKKHGQEAAQKGTAIHASIEQHFSGEPVEIPDHEVIVYAFVDALKEHFGEQEWVAEQSFSSPIGYGGKTDLHCPTIILDTKSKDFGEDEIVKAYPEQIIQLDAYRHGLGIPKARMANVFVSRSHPGLVQIVEHEEGNHFERFKLLLEYWKLDRNFDSSWEEE